MGYRLLVDENVEYEVYRRLSALGHEVEHVDFVDRLGKGASDEEIAQYSVEQDRTIVTYDDDFVREIPTDRYRAVLFFDDQTVDAGDVTAIVHAVSRVYPHEEVSGLQKVGREWL